MKDLLKLKYWEFEVNENQAHWKREILNFCQQLQEILEDSPIAPLDQVLDENWLP